MRILVAGGAGFIGSHLCDKLIEEGNYVVCVDNLMRGLKKNIEHLFGNPNFKFYERDLTDYDSTLEILTNEKIEYVYHLAANSDIQASAKDPSIEYDCTMRTTWVLLDCMRRLSIKQMFFASTSAVYGEQCDTALREDFSICTPISFYGACKTASEAYIQAFAHMCDMSVLVFRFPNVIGPRLTHGVIYDFIGRLKQNPDELTVLGNGTQEKPYLHVFDLVDAIMKFSRVLSPGVEIYNVGVESASKVSTIAEIVIDEMGLKDTKIKYGSENIGWKGDVPRFEYNLDKVHKAGWCASMTSDDAVRRTAHEVLHS